MAHSGRMFENWFSLYWILRGAPDYEESIRLWGKRCRRRQTRWGQVEVHYLEGGSEQSTPGVDLETFTLDSQLVRDQVRELLSRTFGDSKLLDVSTLTTLVGPGVGVNNSRSAGFCLKINHRVENRLYKKVERTISNLPGEEERGQRARAADGGSERESRRATQDPQGDQGDPSDGQKNP